MLEINRISSLSRSLSQKKIMHIVLIQSGRVGIVGIMFRVGLGNNLYTIYHNQHRGRE